MSNDAFNAWVTELDEAVIQGEFGYEPGEFAVFPECWRRFYDEGLTPRAAWQRSLDAFAEDRRDRERRQWENWERIQAEDAALIGLPARDTGEGERG
jgi:hypothetical protein